jgi:hypothetical protein
MLVQAAVMAVSVSGLFENNSARKAIGLQLIGISVPTIGNQWVVHLWNLAIPLDDPGFLVETWLDGYGDRSIPVSTDERTYGFAQSMPRD